MAGQVLSNPRVCFDTEFGKNSNTGKLFNYMQTFNWLNQYLPDTYEKEFERYGNRTISSFLRMVGAEMPTNSDLIKWAEQGRLHTKYTQVGCASLRAAAANDQVVFQVNDALDPGSWKQVIRVGQTIVIVSKRWFRN